MGTNRLGDSWPNVVVVGGKETGKREKEREEWEKVKGEEAKGLYDLYGDSRDIRPYCKISETI